MRKTFRKRIDVSKLKLEGLQKSNIMCNVYVGRMIDDAFEALSERINFIYGVNENGEHTN